MTMLTLEEKPTEILIPLAFSVEGKKKKQKGGRALVLYTLGKKGS